MSRITSIKGFADMFAPESEAFTHMEKIARQVFSTYNFKELRTPILEHTELFARGIGTETDVVQKEMYTFTDKGDRLVTMRPEATAGVMRAYLESGRYKQESVAKFFTFGPMFRYERPQKGRMRQFHQINCECLGPGEPAVDAEMITMVMNFMDSLEIKDLKLHLNSLGCKNCRPIYRDILYKYLSNIDKNTLCEDCQRRMETNPLRVLDCKLPSCKVQTEHAPVIVEHLCTECHEHFETVKILLKSEDIDFFLNPHLVRGLDYYSRTTFELVSQAIGAQGSVAGGGRYDGLSVQLGGVELNAIGFACGMERLAMLLPEAEPVCNDFHIAPLVAEALPVSFKLCQTLRNAGLTGDMNYSVKSMKATMRGADKSGANYVILIGEDELETNCVSFKNMCSGEQFKLEFSKIIDEITKQPKG